jgi:hypothetical protein
VTTKTKKTSFRYVGTHVGDLHDGSPLEPGEFVQLDDDAITDPHNARLISEGLLLEVPAEKKETSA